MKFFNLFVRKDINEGIERYLKEEKAVLLDVRTNEEYAAGISKEVSICLLVRLIEPELLLRIRMFRYMFTAAVEKEAKEPQLI